MTIYYKVTDGHELFSFQILCYMNNILYLKFEKIFVMTERL